MDKVIDFLARAYLWLYGIFVNPNYKPSQRRDDKEDRFWDIVSCGVDEEKAYNMASHGLDTSAIDSTDNY